MKACRTFICALAAAHVMLPSASAAAEPTDIAVKAQFLPRFARYVTWPVAAMPKGADPFVLCVIGGDPFGAMLDDAARSQLIDGRRIVVKRLESAAAAESCQIAFVDGTRAGQLISAIGGKPVLTVTDAGSGVQRGIIHFTIASGRVRFFIDQVAAAQRGIQISSRLLALALGVRQ